MAVVSFHLPGIPGFIFTMRCTGVRTSGVQRLHIHKRRMLLLAVYLQHLTTADQAPTALRDYYFFWSEDFRSDWQILVNSE